MQLQQTVDEYKVELLEKTAKRQKLDDEIDRLSQKISWYQKVIANNGQLDGVPPDMIGLFLASIRKEKGLHLEDLAAKTNVSVATLERLERKDYRNAKIEVLSAVCRELGCSLSWKTGGN